MALKPFKAPGARLALRSKPASVYRPGADGGAEVILDISRLLSRSLQSNAASSVDGDAVYLELLDRVAELVELASARRAVDTSPATSDASETTLY